MVSSSLLEFWVGLCGQTGAVGYSWSLKIPLKTCLSCKSIFQRSSCWVQGRALHPGAKDWERDTFIKLFPKLKPVLRLQTPCSLPGPFGCSSQCGTGKTRGANTQKAISTGKWSSAGILHPHSSCFYESWQRIWPCLGPG